MASKPSAPPDRGAIDPPESLPAQDRPLGQIRREAVARLRAAGIDSAERDAGLLIRHTLGFGREDILLRPEQPVAATAEARLRDLLARRAGREPVSRILGSREFWSLEFQLGPDTLDPRPDSETLIAAALDQIGDPTQPLTVLDLGTGTGCLLLAALAELPNATGIGLDISPGAVVTAAGNAERLGFSGRARFRTGDWRGGLSAALGEARFDLILSNPPYIAEGEIAGLQPEVARFDPYRALAGGIDGLAAYRQLVPQLPGRLTGFGVACLEVGAGQSGPVVAMLESVGCPAVTIRHDHAGIERCIIARFGGQNRHGFEKPVGLRCLHD
ncbi:MAG: peptide chain release factor N(5)-glutamine methyltransferase [Azospirillum sp.]|nr:peptide chain release factor N(5)-glutamine methyltransferase [Azospirillum sp.]